MNYEGNSRIETVLVEENLGTSEALGLLKDRIKVGSGEIA